MGVIPFIVDVPLMTRTLFKSVSEGLVQFTVVCPSPAVEVAFVTLPGDKLSIVIAVLVASLPA